MANLHGILAMVLAVAVFIAADALVKYGGARLNSAQAIGVYSMFATAWLALAIAATGAWRRWRSIADRRLLLRSALGCAGLYAYLVALFQIPLGIATAVKLSSPLMLAVLAVVLLRQRVDGRTWWALGAGFAGVLLVVRPSAEALDFALWLALLATLANALRDVTTRIITTAVPALVIAFTESALAAVVGCSWALAEGWQEMMGGELAILGAASLLLAGGYQLIVLAMRLGDVAVIGAFRYSAILWAVAIGYALWSEVPHLPAVAGIALIVTSGLYLVHRERRHARSSTTDAAPSSATSTRKAGP
jgi:drug/metabolite transporter (DMT)-like permease